MTVEIAVNSVVEKLKQVIGENWELPPGVVGELKLVLEDFERLKPFFKDGAEHYSEKWLWENMIQKIVHEAVGSIDKFLVQSKMHSQKGKMRKLSDKRAHVVSRVAFKVEINSIRETLKNLQPKPLLDQRNMSMKLAEDIPDPVSVLQRIENEYDFSKYHKKLINLMKTELWFLGKFLLLDSGDLQIKIKNVLKFAEDVLGCASNFVYSYVLETIESVRLLMFRHNILDEYRYYFETTAPAVTTTPLTHEPVVEYIDNVVQNAKDLLIVRLVDKPPTVSNEAQSTTYSSVKAQVELLEKELRAIRNFVCFLGKICSSEQQDYWQTFLRHADIVTTGTAIAF